MGSKVTGHLGYWELAPCVLRGPREKQLDWLGLPARWTLECTCQSHRLGDRKQMGYGVTQEACSLARGDLPWQLKCCGPQWGPMS